MVSIVFWLSLIMLLYTYAGYPAIIWLLGVLFPRKVDKRDIYPPVSLVISAYNEESNLERKIRNCLDLDYPKDKLEILIGSDGSTDKTKEIAEKHLAQGVRFFALKARQGKASVLNYLVPRAQGEIIVFADARQIFDRQALKKLVRNFADEKVGCVSGELILNGEEDSAVGKGLGMYWNYEKFLRKQEGAVYSMVGATGAIYAVRKKLYVPPPNEILLDDVFIPLLVVRQGYRAIFESAARAYDTVSRTPGEETARKIRTLAGNWQIFVYLQEMLNPFRHRIALMFFSHKVLRVLVPYFLMALFASNVFLLDNFWYACMLFSQLMFYGCAWCGSQLAGHRIKIFSVPYTFCLLNINVIRGLYAFVTNTQKVTWAKH